MVSEKMIFKRFSDCWSMEAIALQGVASLDPRILIGRIYAGIYVGTLLHTKYITVCLMLSGKKTFACFWYFFGFPARTHMKTYTYTSSICQHGH